MRAWVTLLALAIALAGCSGGKDSSDPTPSPSPSTSPTASLSPSPPPLPNAAPAAQLSASVESGSLPLAVDFTVDAADTDGDELAWTLDADGDGTADANGTDAELPANVTFTYETEGTFNATLNVTDGEDFDTATVRVDVSAALAGEDRQSVSGEWTVGTPGCAAMGQPGAGGQKLPYVAGTPLEGVAWTAFPVTPGTVGHPFHAAFAISTAWIYVEVVFYDADGAALLAANDALDQGNDGHVRGEVPDGAATGVLYPCDPVPSTVTYEAGPGVA